MKIPKAALLLIILLVYNLSAVSAFQYFFRTEDKQVNAGLIIRSAITVPDDYPTIQKAINAASDGDTIFVRNGTYYENIVVSKSLVILGENALSTILDSHDSGSFNVDINANVTLSGFTLQNGYSGIFVNHPCTVNIKNNIIRNQYYYGVFVQTWGTCNVTVQDNLIATSYGGIQISYSEGFCALERNELSQVGSGIMIGYGMMNGNVVNNTITGNGSGTGIDLSDFYNGTIEGNSITGFMDCAWLEDTSGNLVTRNVLAANTGFGLGIISSDNNTVTGNDILNNGFGLWLSSSSRNNVIWRNNFINNSQQVNIADPSYPNAWDNGFEGNYWSDYNGTDSNGDGIGDIPYIIDANNTDYYPLMNVYWKTCDISHDLIVDMHDIGIAAAAFLTVPGDARWNPHADITGPQMFVPDGLVDMMDIGTIASHFLESYP